MILGAATALSVAGATISTLLLWLTLARARARLAQQAQADQTQEAGDAGPDPVLESYRIARASAVIQ